MAGLSLGSTGCEFSDWPEARVTLGVEEYQRHRKYILRMKSTRRGGMMNWREVLWTWKSERGWRLAVWRKWDSVQ